MVLEALSRASLSIATDKCKLASKELQYLGHIVSGQGIKPDPSKTAKIQAWPKPTNKTETQQFLGLCNYVRKFIKDFAHLAQQLRALSTTPKPPLRALSNESAQLLSSHTHVSTRDSSCTQMPACKAWVTFLPKKTTMITSDRLHSQGEPPQSLISAWTSRSSNA